MQYKWIACQCDIAGFYTGSISALETLLSEGKEPTLSDKAPLKGQTVNRTVTAQQRRGLDPSVLAHLDTQLQPQNYEKGLVGSDGLMYVNGDFGIVDGCHIPSLVELAQKPAAASLTYQARRVATTLAERKHKEPKNLTRRDISIDGDSKSVVPTRAVALYKAAHHGLVFRKGDKPFTLCFSGHWTSVESLEGDHAYPGSFVIERLFHFFSDANTRKASEKPPVEAKDPRDEVPEVWRYQNDKTRPNKALFLMAYLDARNSVGICSECNQSKGNLFIHWLLGNPYYGPDFLKAEFPLNYSTIVPRTKTGQGLGDAMIRYFFTVHATREALNLRNQWSITEQPVANTAISQKAAVTAIDVVQMIASNTLTPTEQLQLRTLLEAIKQKVCLKTEGV